MRLTETICAQATPAGGAICVVRVSGPQAFVAVGSIFSRPLAEAPSHKVIFGNIIDASGSVIDEVLVTLFRAPHSYTGEDSAEISCHGSAYIVSTILQLLIAQGCRMAEPGEFTRRAFANGRIDLSQAEAVADLIASQNAASHRLAMSQMKGSVSRKLESLRDQLLQISSLLELELDFSEEDVEFADRVKLLDLAKAINAEVCRLASTFRQGQAIKDGIPVAIIGAPNVGKSTLLNQLLKDDRAIVSPIEGTTRDLVEDTITLGGFLFRFIDTAGIRNTTDQIEAMGIERSRKAAQKAQIVIMMAEPNVAFPDIELKPEQSVIRITNKTPHFQALTGIGVEALEKQLIALASPTDITSDVILTNQRHFDALTEAHRFIEQVILGLDQHLSGDLVAEDLRAVIEALNSILGRGISSQDTLNNIFQHFCIGK